MAAAEEYEDVFGRESDDEGSDEQTGADELIGDEGSDSDSDSIACKIHNPNPWLVIGMDVNRVTRKRFRKQLEVFYREEKNPKTMAMEKAYHKMHDYVLDAFLQAYISHLKLHRALSKDKTNRKVMETAKRLRDSDDFGFDESIKYAVRKRRFLLSTEMDKVFHQQSLFQANYEESGGETDLSAEGSEKDEEVNEESKL